MIRHIVCFALHGNDPEARRRSADTLQKELETLPAQIECVRLLEVGLDLRIVDGHWDAVLVTEFDSVDDLAAYQAHPAHLAVVERIAPLIERRAVVDYPG